MSQYGVANRVCDRKLQQLLHQAWLKSHKVVLIGENVFDAAMLTRINVAHQKHANDWFTCMPSRADLVMSDREFRTSVCIRLNIPPVALTPQWRKNLYCSGCSAHADLVDDPFHAIHCSSENGAGRRLQHNRVQKRLGNFASLCGHYAELEPKMFSEESTKKRPDGFIAWSGGEHTLFDVRGFDSLAPSYRGKSTQQLTEAAAKDKIKKYAYISKGECPFPNIKMQPFIFDTLGGLSKSAVSMLRRLAMKGALSSSRNIQKLVREEVCAMSICIQRDNTAIVMRCFENARPL